MRRALLPIAAIIVLGCFFWQLGYVSSFELRLAWVKREIRARLNAGVPEEERVDLSFSPEEARTLNWVAEGREFQWQGRYYDVIERTVEPSGRIRLVCIDDKDEAGLFASLERMVERAMDVPVHGRSCSAEIIASWDVFIAPNFTAILMPPAADRMIGSLGLAAVLPAHEQVDVPPPKG